MASSGFRLDFNDHELRNLLENPNGLTGRRMLARAGETVARGARSRSSKNILTGRMYDSVGWRYGHDIQGLYVDVYTIWYAKFLDKPAKQIRRANRFLRNALRDIAKTHLGSY